MSASPSRDEIATLLRDILIDLFEFRPEQVTAEAHIVDDLDLDSIDAVDIIVQIQEKTGRTIDPERFKAIRTVGDMIDEACRIPAE